jgi:hypothetical protein
VAFEQTVLTEREYVNVNMSNLWTKLIVIDLFEKAKLVGLPGYPDLLDIVWREKEPFHVSISYLHQQEPISFRKLTGGCLLESQRSIYYQPCGCVVMCTDSTNLTLAILLNARLVSDVFSEGDCPSFPTQNQ